MFQLAIEAQKNKQTNKQTTAFTNFIGKKDGLHVVAASHRRDVHLVKEKNES